MSELVFYHENPLAFPVLSSFVASQEALDAPLISPVLSLLHTCLSIPVSINHACVCVQPSHCLQLPAPTWKSAQILACLSRIPAALADIAIWFAMKVWGKGSIIPLERHSNRISENKQILTALLSSSFLLLSNLLFFGVFFSTGRSLEMLFHGSFFNNFKLRTHSKMGKSAKHSDLSVFN